MSALWLTPAAPGAVPAAHLDRVRDLHGVVRDWIERSAVAKPNAHLLANLPYVDLMFAFGFATLGDHPTANKLVEAARVVMEGPIPVGGSRQADEAITFAVASNCLFGVLKFRVAQALAGKSHSGPLSDSVQSALNRIREQAGGGPVNNPHKLAVYVVDRFRNLYRIAEPDESVDPYADWTKHGDGLKRALAELASISAPMELAQRVRALFREGAVGDAPNNRRLRILHQSLPLAPRVGAEFVAELLHALVTSVDFPGENGKVTPDLSTLQSELFERALRLAVRYGNADHVASLADRFATLIASNTETTRLKLIAESGAACLNSLRQFGLRVDAERHLNAWGSDIFRGASVDELRVQNSERPERWSDILRALLSLVVGWQWLNVNERVEPILAVARRDLYSADTHKIQTKDCVDIARAYIAAVGNDMPGAGFGRLTELFTQMPLKRTTNTWKTAQYYSRFHLQIVEDTVFAVCRICRNDAAPVVMSR